MTRCFLPNPPTPHPPHPTPHTPTPSLGVAKGIRGGRAKGRGYTLPHRTPWAKGAVTQPIDPALPPSRPHCGLFYNLEPQFTAWLGNQTPRSPSHRSLSHMELLLIPTYFFFLPRYGLPPPHCNQVRGSTAFNPGWWLQPQCLPGMPLQPDSASAHLQFITADVGFDCCACVCAGWHVNFVVKFMSQGFRFSRLNPITTLLHARRIRCVRGAPWSAPYSGTSRD